jgi:hypothetical protein
LARIHKRQANAQTTFGKIQFSTKTIQRKIDSIKTYKETTFPSVANVLMNTTYFGEKFGVTLTEPAELWYLKIVLQVLFYTSNMLSWKQII